MLRPVSGQVRVAARPHVRAQLVSAGGSSAPGFTISNTTVTTAWGNVVVGELIPLNAPPGAYFRLRDETAGLAVVNG